MNCIIRKVKNGDESILAYVQTESWKAGFKGILTDEELVRCTDLTKTTHMYKKILDHHIGNGYILEVDGIAHCIAYWDKARGVDEPDCAELICIHSLPNNWRKGFGTKMMEQVLEDVKNAGYKKIMLWVFKDNMRARGFYETSGFITTEKEKPNMIPIEIMYEKEL
ncbi:MAG: GNAT family N-acetyltransferase [Beduini sp.]|uniref:GNAT family N-acetyltransferase n=1 Tax=Beduini sp. TaxID=1922300 RepID=UPI00399F8BF3